MVQFTASLLTLLATVSLTAAKPDCNAGGYLSFHVEEAARCINELAALDSICKTDQAGRVLRKCGSTQIWSHTSNRFGASTPCKNVAVSAGLIMDACTVKDNRGTWIHGAAYVQGNGDFWIRIEGSG
ncbi:hypothetical protein P153DRAFT_432318 [Dothidotthia symphoricarpi CBS 119687]|uniref:Cyanovirin-N domain-containing protein n=1 Tax=Dothidotthia symphoricarpi CBS 119687 TaxID=1392245 RepID=A0A6A6A9J8_9PLEO|nr:uncharacterized protein P153DRAFT_432318 [Dothidotthia symphoricarpi CBS 119687]KAF2127873.1 hypothetical protein P153DRAFT_432318 [Dothidotthia symphoricarpi CBS 119687]